MKLIDAYKEEIDKSGGADERIKTLEQDVDPAYCSDEIPKAILQSQEGLDRVTEIVSALKDFAEVQTGQDKTESDINRAIRSAATVSQNAWKYVADMELHLVAW